MNKNQGSNEIKIGALYPLTGALAPVGKSIQRALGLAQDIVNNPFDLPLAEFKGLFHLGNQKNIRLVFLDLRFSQRIRNLAGKPQFKFCPRTSATRLPPSLTAWRQTSFLCLVHSGTSNSGHYLKD